jgi:ABC-2 type transport system ATP-binding protein
MDATVRISDLSAAYRIGLRAVGALTDISCEIDPGSVTAVIGPNGAGKTTLIRVLLGFLSPSKGAVTVGGITPDRYRRSHGVAYLPEAAALPAGWTVDALLREGARLSGLAGPAAERALATAWARSVFEPGEGKRVQRLSKGLRRQLALAFALVGNPRLVLLDEPTSGLDAEARLRLRRTIGELAADGATIILCSHDLAEVERIAHRVIVLRGGRLAGLLEGGVQAALEEIVVGQVLSRRESV